MKGTGLHQKKPLRPGKYSLFNMYVHVCVYVCVGGGGYRSLPQVRVIIVLVCCQHFDDADDDKQFIIG